ncbi:MAG TPA: DNA translocase FtsK 4TM domain-containing protein [Burkholderiaceae bacterium]|nr:DNA translocase FtsK 4TM domain-containing protein [Burkholderiaceae bacterium]
MSYSSNTFNSENDPSKRTAGERFVKELGLILGLLVLLFWLISLLSYTTQDAAWSTTGVDSLTRNWGGRLGAYVSDASYFFFGFSVWWLVLALGYVWLTHLAKWMRHDDRADPLTRPLKTSAMTQFRDEGQLLTPRVRFWLGLLLLVGSSVAIEWARMQRLEAYLPGFSGGVFGYELGIFSTKMLGFTGAALACICLGIMGASMTFGFSWNSTALRLGAWIEAFWLARRQKQEIAEDLAFGKQAALEREIEVVEERETVAEQHPIPLKIEPVLAEPPPSLRVAKERQKPLFADMIDSKLPQVELLDAAPGRQETVSPETLEMTSRLIEKKLKDFGVEVRVILASPGPVITRYEIEPAIGVKGSQIVGLAKDLARSLSLVSIRVVETIPGKNYMALELPNARRQAIKLSEILGSSIYNEAKSLLTMGLGKDIVGHAVIADLAKMPHVLVAGTTGSGKSVGINAMILSLLYKAEARDVRLLMIDPKMLEMSVYEGIPHLIAPVVTDMRQAAHGLNWCVAEMERRYKLLSKMGVRNLAGYNGKIDEAKSRGEFLYNPFSLTPDSPEPLSREPHIVVVIDELADLMMVVGKKIEELIARLAQKARAAGIHLILATQRPSVDVITGLIKANIPTRISFQVSSKIDSRTILDQQGAEALLGMGDMLYMASGTGLPIRVHGAYVSDEEVHRVVSYLKTQGEPDYIEGVLEGGTVDGDSDLMGDGLNGSSGEKDPLYDQAVEVVLKNRKASISLVQRHLKIGYNRAARLVEDMEKAGMVSAMSSNGQREILVPNRAE